jgi:DNA-binding SARP family transcriptional activator/Tfp pilus assembly protein PilF
MRFSVLGRLQVISDDGTELRIPQPRQRALLAVLLLHANQELSAGRLTESLWEQEGAALSPGALRTQVWAVRRLLAPAQRLHTGDHSGYQMEVHPGELDAAQFRQLAGHGRHALGTGDLPGAVSSLERALALWGEPPLADVPTTLAMGPPAQRLLDERLAARDLLTEARLSLGQHADLIPELRESTAAAPANERLWEQLMLALHCVGRTADALAAYQQARTSMKDELGLEPGLRLQQLHRRILANDPELMQRQPERILARGPDLAAPPVVPSVPVPRQLPAGVPHFAGRAGELRFLAELADHAADRNGSAGMVVISAIGGTAGVGKTALAIHWAHQVAARFGAGQLYVNLRGFDPTGTPAAPAEAIRGFLDALGVAPDRVPHGLDAQTGMYRSLLSGKQMLIVLDNARDEHQVRPLLPGSPGCVVIITSRSQLTGLAASNSARLITLDLLTAAEARQMLAARLGAERAAAEPGAVSEIADLCGRLPLALAVAAARFAARPQFPLAVLAAELRDTASRLDALETADPTASVRTVFSWSYQELSPAAARMFRLVGLHPGPDIAAGAAASLAACSLAHARRALAELTGAHLLTEHGHDRYLCHDLLRTYATEQARTTDSDSDREAATGRLLDYYLHTAHAATRLLSPSREPITLPAPRPGVALEQLSDTQQAMAWFDAEQDVIFATVALAAEKGSGHAWQIPWTITDFLDRRGFWNETAAILGTALAAATTLGDAAGQAVTRHRMAFACARLTRYDEARVHLAACLELCRQIGDRAGEARAYQTLSYVAERQGHYADALRHGEQALRVFQDTGNTGGQVVSLNDIGWCHALLGNYQQAQSFCEQARILWRELGDRNGEAHTWDSLGYIAHRLGQHTHAVGCYQRALGLFRELKDRFNEAEILIHLADTHHTAGELHQARDAWHQALAILDELHHPTADEVRAKLAAAGEGAPAEPAAAEPAPH